jgi:hypothetical protein
MDRAGDDADPVFLSLRVFDDRSTAGFAAAGSAAGNPSRLVQASR